MRKEALVRKYARGLVGALSSQAEVEAVLGELTATQALLREHAELASVLSTPFVPRKNKDQIIREVLGGCPACAKTARFLDLLLEHRRLDILEDVLRLVPELWRESQGIETFEVSSAVPVAPPQRLRLQAELERREGRPVFLEYRIDPGLVGGLSLRKGNIILDVSLRGRLAQLKERLIEG